jgi:hypothetical protein
MTWTPDESFRPVLSAFDRYMDWALFSERTSGQGAGRRDYLPQGADGYKVRIMVRPRTDLPTLLKQLDSLPAIEQRDWSALRRALTDLSPGEGQQFFTFFMTLDESERLFGPLAAGVILDPEQFFDLVTFGPALPESGVRTDLRGGQPHGASGAGPAAPPRSVVVGIIDDGLAFGHERFRLSATTTRLGALWLQDGPFDGTSASVDYGREIFAQDIDGWLSQSAGDEDIFYGPGQAGVLDFALSGRKPLAQRLAHGTHVLDVAFGLEAGAAQDWRIVGVQLPVSVVADSSGALLTPYAVDAVRYIERKARELSPGAPIVIAFSYGFTAGPHDGTHPIERGIDEIVTAHNTTYPNAPMRIVIPAGNTYLARLHACIRFAEPTQQMPNPPRTAELLWRVQPGDTTPSFVEIWLPGDYDPAGRIGIALTTPDGEMSGELVEGQKTVLTLTGDGLIICQVFHRADPLSKRAMFLVALQPTERMGSGPVAPAGLWTIHLKNRGFEGDETVAAWIQRDEPPFGYPPRGRQSYFDHADYSQFDPTGREEEEDDPDSIVQRSGSMNALATGTTPLVVGGLVRKELRPPKYSAGGPSLHGPHFRPSALVTSDDSLVHGGVIAAGTRSGSWVAMNGTSVAGPRIARWIAGEMEENRSSSRAAVEEFATEEELSLPSPRPSPERGGAGRLRLPHTAQQPRHRRFEAD